MSEREFITRGNGANSDPAYDLASRLTSFTQDMASTGQDLTRSFSYNAASQILSRTTSNNAYKWTQPISNQAYVANRLNQYASVGGVTFSHDLNGNLTSDGSRSFAFDVENRLLAVSGSASMTLTYDPLGRLKSTASGGTTTEYLYEGDRLIAEYQGSTVLRRYAHGPGIDEPVVWYEGSGLGTKNYLHADERGSIIATSNSSGAATIYTYGPYGEPHAWTGTRFRYTGQIALPEVQLYHYKARVYDPKLGRFLQADPVGYEDDWNLYAYVQNDPLNSTDPTGENAWDDFKQGFQAGAVEVVQGDYSQLSTVATAGNQSMAYTFGKGLGKGLAVRGSTGPGGGPAARMPGARMPGTANMSQATHQHSRSNREKFRQAKEVARVPKSQQMQQTRGGDRAENVRTWEGKNSEGKAVVIREDKAASYDDGGRGNQPPHFNISVDGKDTKHHVNISQPVPSCDGSKSDCGSR